MSNYNELFRIEFGSKSFQDYISIVEMFFITEIDQLQSEHRSALAEINTKYWNYEPEEANYIEGQIIDRMYEMDVEFRNRFRSSIIIQLFSFLELELKKFCENHSKIFAKEYTLNDLKGNNELDKVKKYLKNSANIDITSNTILWNFINDFRKLRNKIVHNESNVLDSDGDFNSIKKFSINNFWFEKNSVEKPEYKIIFDKPEFLLVCVNQIELFLKQVTSQ